MKVSLGWEEDDPSVLYLFAHHNWEEKELCWKHGAGA